MRDNWWGRAFAVPSLVEAVRGDPLPRLGHSAWVQVSRLLQLGYDIWVTSSTCKAGICMYIVKF